MVSAVGTLSLLILPDDALVHALSDSEVKAEDLCVMRLVCKRIQALIDAQEQNPIWRCLSMREQLRPMTEEEQNAQTYQHYFRRNWVFCQLNNGRIPLATPQHRFYAVLLLATRAGHETLTCQVFDKNAGNIVNHTYIQHVLVEAAERGQEETVRKILPLVPYASHRHDQAFINAACKGHLGIVNLLKATVYSKFSKSDAMGLAIVNGHINIVQFLLDNFPEAYQGEIFYFNMAAVTGQQKILELLNQDLPEDIPLKVEKAKKWIASYFYAMFESYVYTQYQNGVQLFFHLVDKCSIYLPNEKIRELMAFVLRSRYQIAENSQFMIELFLTKFGDIIARDEKLATAIIDRFVQRPEFKIETIINFFNQMRANDSSVPLEVFYSGYARVLRTAVFTRNLELVKALLNTDQPKIPYAFARVFIKITLNPEIATRTI